MAQPSGTTVIGVAGKSGWDHVQTAVATSMSAGARRSAWRKLGVAGTTYQTNRGKRFLGAICVGVVTLVFCWLLQGIVSSQNLKLLFMLIGIAAFVGLPYMALLGVGPTRGAEPEAVLPAVVQPATTVGQAQLPEISDPLEAARRGDMSGIPAEARSWAWGALGEEETGRALAQLGAGWIVAHDLRIVDSTSTWYNIVKANIDHVVAGPRGAIAMVDTKRWAGTLLPSRDGRGLDCDGDAQAREIRQNSLETLFWEAEQLRGCELIVIAVAGRGSVAGGGFELKTKRDQPRVVAVPVDALNQTLYSLLQGSGPGFDRAVNTPTVRVVG